MSTEPEKAQKNMDYVAVNAYEELVRSNVLTMMNYMDMCTCQKCISDACALVLNQLIPQYVTTRKGELLTQLPEMSLSNHIDLTVKVVHALRMVKDSPQH